ncbi:putative phospholipase D [Yersinia kristensenii]|nr:putative phospholipase D [Yersinia kristensenii]
MRQSLIVPLACLLLLPVFSPSVFAVEIITGFSPSGTAQTVVLDAIQEAKHTINLAAYSFTSKPVSLALLAAQKRGVVVRVLADEKANSTQYTAVTFLANQGVPVRLIRRYKIFHHKFAVIDNQSVQTGSFNYSAAADKSNAENVVYLRGSPATAAAYTQEFNRLWAEGYQLESRYPAHK